MNPGELTHKITIQFLSTDYDNEQNVIENWSDFTTVWAKPIPKSGREYFKLQNMNGEMTEAFKIRYINITTRNRIKFKCKYFEIIDIINEDEKNEWLVVTCKGVV